MDRNANKVRSIEILDTSNLSTCWKLIEAPNLGERIFPGVQALNNSEIVILGGNDAIWNFLSDCYVFNIHD